MADVRRERRATLRHPGRARSAINVMAKSAIGQASSAQTDAPRVLGVTATLQNLRKISNVIFVSCWPRRLGRVNSTPIDSALCTPCVPSGARCATATDVIVARQCAKSTRQNLCCVFEQYWGQGLLPFHTAPARRPYDEASTAEPSAVSVIGGASRVLMCARVA